MVRHSDVPEWEAKGWVDTGNMPDPHDYWSVLMEYAGPLSSPET